MQEYLYLFLFLSIGSALACFLLFISWIKGKMNGVNKNDDFQKLRPYECGFDAFTESSSLKDTFHIYFYRVAILFILFDIEIIFLFPWSLNLHKTSSLRFWSMISFIGIITIGFAYEWVRKGLEWED
jgi:NADH-quinone oxidoreductase subunit A